MWQEVNLEDLLRARRSGLVVWSGRSLRKTDGRGVPQREVGGRRRKNRRGRVRTLKG